MKYLLAIALTVLTNNPVLAENSKPYVLEPLGPMIIIETDELALAQTNGALDLMNSPAYARLVADGMIDRSDSYQLIPLAESTAQQFADTLYITDELHSAAHASGLITFDGVNGWQVPDMAALISWLELGHKFDPARLSRVVAVAGAAVIIPG
jgi:hypothetical protein